MTTRPTSLHCTQYLIKNKWFLYTSIVFMLIRRICMLSILAEKTYLVLARMICSTLSVLPFIHIVQYPMIVYSYILRLWIDASYWGPCKSECIALQDNCGPFEGIDCNDYEENDFFCHRAVSSVHFPFFHHLIGSIPDFLLRKRLSRPLCLHSIRICKHPSLNCLLFLYVLSSDHTCTSYHIPLYVNYARGTSYSLLHPFSSLS